MLENKINNEFKKLEKSRYELIDDISNYVGRDYINKFYLKVKDLTPDYQRSLLSAISVMCNNIGKEEELRTLSNRGYLTSMPDKFIKYHYDNTQVKIFDIPSHYNRNKVKKKHNNFKSVIRTNKLPNEILTTMLERKNFKENNIFNLPGNYVSQSFQ